MESLVHLPYLTIGSKVEVSSKEEGYKGSYFTATIIVTPQPTTNINNTYVIQYDNITNEDGTKPLRELAHVSCIRPLPPQPLVEDKEQHSSCSFVLNDVVEAFYNDGWWVGVVDKVKRNGGGSGGGGEMKRYSVRFEDPLHFIEFDENLLRPHFDWVDGKWVSFDSSTKKTTPASFKSHRKGLLEKSLSSEKISLNVISPSKTQQETITPRHCSKKPRKEEGEGTLSHVSKDKSKVKPYALENERSTLSKSKKAKKSLEETSPETKFIDVICGSLSAMEKKRADGREHLRKSVLEKSGLSSEKKSVDMVLPNKKRQLEILTSRHCSKKLKSVECGGASFSASKDKSNPRPYVLENEGSTFSLVQHLQSGVSVPRKRRVRRRPKKFGQVSSGHECKTVTDSASAGKEPKVNMTAEAFKFQNTENTILRSDETVMMRVSTNEGPELESITFEASHREPENGEKTVIDSASTENESGLGITPLHYQFQNTKTVMMGASTEAGPESESITDTASAGKTVTDTASASAGKEPKVNITAEAFKFQDTENTILRSDETVMMCVSTKEGPELESITFEASQREPDNGEKIVRDSASTENESGLGITPLPYQFQNIKTVMMGASTEAGPESESITVEASPCKLDNCEKNVMDSATENEADLVTSPLAFQIQNTENTVEQTVEVSSPHSSNIPHSGQVGNGYKDIVPLEASQCELDNCDMTLLDSAAIVNESGLGQVRNADGGNDENEIITTFASTQEKPESESITPEVSRCELNNGDKSVMAKASTKNELELKITAGASQFQNSEDTFEHAVDASSQYSGSVRNGDGDSNEDEIVTTFVSTKDGLELGFITVEASPRELDNGAKTVKYNASTENESALETTPPALVFQNTENTTGQTVNVSSPCTSIIPPSSQVRNGNGGSNEDELVTTFASIKEGSESESITVGASQCEFDHGDKTAMATKNELEFDIIAGALQFQDWEITFDDTVELLSECTTIIPNSGQVRNGDGGSNGDETVLTFASTEEGLELESVTLDASRSESTFVESGLQELTAKETVENSSTSDREKDTRITIMELTAGTKTTSEVVLPFVKNLIIWETLESFEVYKKMPQKPHFRPLYEEVELLREGLAIGRVVTFINIVDIIGKLRFDDSNSPAISTLIEDILKVLPEFDEHGFDTEPLKNHLGKLVSARSNVAQLEVEAKETKSQLMEKSCDKIRIKEKSNVVVKELVKIVKKLKDLEDQKVNNTSQIVKLTSSLDSITGSLEAAHQELHKLAGGF